MYFVPSTVVLLGTQTRNASAIGCLNLLPELNVIGWLAALLWAFAKDAPAANPSGQA
jgi:hypothetical protein